MNEIENLINGLCDYYRREPMGALAIDFYGRALLGYTPEQINAAAMAHVADPVAGKFMPTAADLLAQLQGKKPSPAEVIAMARAASCPLGVIARIAIGTYDLDKQDDFYLIERAKEFLAGYEALRERAARGQYDDHEIMIMCKHKINPLREFLPGAAPPSDDVKRALKPRVLQLIESLRYAFLLEKPSDENDKTALPAPNVAKRLAQIIDEPDPEREARKQFARERLEQAKKMIAEARA